MPRFSLTPGEVFATDYEVVDRIGEGGFVRGGIAGREDTPRRGGLREEGEGVAEAVLSLIHI